MRGTVHTKRVKDILAHTVGSSRREVVQQFSISGVSSALVGIAGASSGSVGAVLGGAGGPSNAVGEQVATLSKQLNDLRAVQQAQIDTTNQNTQALLQNTVTKSSGSSATNTAGSLIS